jgi:lipopolysaccharide biosynthesis regulator YciM
MRKIQLLNILLLITTISSCQNKKNITEKNVIKENPECEILYNKYIEKFSNSEKDSALFYIDKCIKCDTSKKDNKYIKAQLLISMKDYKNAILTFNDIKSDDDPALKMQKGVLMLKINDPNSIKVLKECYNEFNQIKEATSSNLFYRIALDNYFKGKEYSLNEVVKFKEKNKGKAYENQNIKALEDLINKENKETVLFKLFNIRD